MPSESTGGTDRFEVAVTLSAGATVEAKSIEDAMAEAKRRNWSSKNPVRIVVHDPETGEELEAEL